MLRKAFLFIPIIMLVATLFMGYSVIRAGTMAMVSAAVVSWFTPHRMGIRALLEALALGARAVMIGRPWVYALAARQKAGVEALIQLFANELRVAMALTGCSRLEDIDRSVIAPDGDQGESSRATPEVVLSAVAGSRSLKE
jgi:hypothetical protein